MLEGIDGADGRFGFEGGKCVHSCPEVDGIAEFAFGDAAEPLMPFAEDEGATFFLQGFAIAFEHGAADVLALDREASGFGGEVGADGQAHEINGVGHGPGLVEIVDAPDEAAFDVAPGSEVLDVEIAYGEDLRSVCEIGTNLLPDLRPAVVGGAEEHEDVRLHVGVFEAKIFLFDLGAQGQPRFELAGGFDNMHGGNDSGWGNGKSNESETTVTTRYSPIASRLLRP